MRADVLGLRNLRPVVGGVLEPARNLHEDPVRIGRVDAAQGLRASALARLRSVLNKDPKLMPARLLVAQLLVAEAERRIRARGLATARLAVERDNERALRLYQYLGYSRVGQRAIALTRERKPGVVLMDLRMPVLDGVAAIEVITHEQPDIRVLALTSYDGDADVRRALKAGARGYLLKDMLVTNLVGAVRAVHRGQRVMPSSREAS